MRFETSGQGSKNRIFTPFGDFYIDVENLFDQVLENTPFAKGSGEKQHNAGNNQFRPNAKLVEFESAFVISMDLPGVQVGDVSIEFLDGELTVSGERKVNEVEEGQRVLQDSCLHGKFERKLRLDAAVDDDQIKASYENGVLEITVAKAAKPVARKIEIKTNDSAN